MLSKLRAVTILFYLISGAAFAQVPDPFNYLKVGVDDEGFITLAEDAARFRRKLT